MAAGGLDRLTERERRVLRLLASGHSEKSAAGAEAITENAANELLRSARRKLGTGSSREAARLLAEREDGPQKNRDEKSVIPPPPQNDQSPQRFSKGTIAMSLTALAASAAVIFAVLTGGSGSEPAVVEAPQGSRTMPDETSTGANPAGVPKVIATMPAQGAVIAPGPFRVAITFDRPMAPGSFAFSRSDEGAHPECAGPPQLSVDGRTYSLDCVASAGARYVMHFNKPPHVGFLDAATRAPAQEARLEFTVAGNAASAAPKVVQTVPAQGAMIAPGPFTTSVTFDRPMLPQAMSVVRTNEGAFPECPSPPRLSADGRTYSMECVASAPGAHVVYFNRPPYMNFRDARTQTSAEPMRLEFTVRGG
jgi:DNA-binding CsgD family transcriptional regulator